VPAAGSSSADGAGPLPQVPDDASELDHDPAQGPNLVQRIDDWLAKGFPSGVPRQDRVPLLALLGPRLTDAQVDEIARRLVTSAGPFTRRGDHLRGRVGPDLGHHA
jgi:hypothetical protein